MKQSVSQQHNAAFRVAAHLEQVALVNRIREEVARAILREADFETFHNTVHKVIDDFAPKGAIVDDLDIDSLTRESFRAAFMGVIDGSTLTAADWATLSYHLLDLLRKRHGGD